MSALRHPPDVAMGRQRTGSQQRGDAAEDLVIAYLARLGWSVVGRNVHVGRSELDIVALDPGPPRRLAVVEVRWRSARTFGLPEETFDRRKRGRVIAGLLGLIAAGRLPDGTPLPRGIAAIDLVVVEPAAAGTPGTARLRHHRDVG